MHNKKLTIKQSIMWNSVGSLWYLGVQWLSTVFVTRILGYEDAGIYSLAMSTANTLYALATYGMRNYQISDIAHKYAHRSYVMSRAVTCAVAMMACIVFVLFGHYSNLQVACVIAHMFFKLSEAVFDVLSGIYQQNWRMDLVGKSQLLRGALFLIIFPTVLYFTKDLFISILVVALLSYSALLLFDRKHIKYVAPMTQKSERKEIWGLLKECTPLAISSFLSAGIASVPRFFIEAYCGNELLGIYAAVAMPTLIVQAGASYVFAPMLTLFAETYAMKSRKAFLRILKKCVIATAAISTVALLGGRLLGTFGLCILYGESIVAYAYLLMPLIVCTCLTAVIWMLGGVLTVVRDLKGMAFGHGGAVLVSFVGALWLVPCYGMQGASYALTMALVVGNSILFWRLYCTIKKF